MWAKTGREFAVTIFGVIVGSAENPQFGGTYKVRWKVMLNDAEDQISGPGRTDIFDTSGNLVESFDTIGEGRRANV